LIFRSIISSEIKEAMKAGLIQKVENSKVIWTTK